MLTEQRLNQLNELLTNLGLTVDDYECLNQALIHSSFTFENKLPVLLNNERLEFLGDAVLKIITSRYLFDRFPEYSEGELTKIRSILVSDNILSKVAADINLGAYLELGFHEEKMGGRKRPSNLACAFEALLGAVYVDGKIEQLYGFLNDLLEASVTEIDNSAAKYNFKAILQEYAQGHGMALPDYQIINEEGPAHDRTFEIEVFVNEESLGRGAGKSKKEAQQKAAEVALKVLGFLEEDEK